MTWGDPDIGGDSSAVAEQLDPDFGGDSSAVADQLEADVVPSHPPDILFLHSRFPPWRLKQTLCLIFVDWHHGGGKPWFYFCGLTNRPDGTIIRQEAEEVRESEDFKAD